MNFNPLDLILISEFFYYVRKDKYTEREFKAIKKFINILIDLQSNKEWNDDLKEKLNPNFFFKQEILELVYKIDKIIEEKNRIIIKQDELNSDIPKGKRCDNCHNRYVQFNVFFYDDKNDEEIKTKMCPGCTSQFVLKKKNIIIKIIKIL